MTKPLQSVYMRELKFNGTYRARLLLPNLQSVYSGELKIRLLKTSNLQSVYIGKLKLSNTRVPTSSSSIRPNHPCICEFLSIKKHPVEG